MNKGEEPRAIPPSKISKWRANAEFGKISGFVLDATELAGKTRGFPFLSAIYQGVSHGSHAEFAANEAISGLDGQAMSQMVKDTIRILEPVYGIGFVRKTIEGPLFYVIGINMSEPGYVPVGDEYQDALRVSRWGGIGMMDQVYRYGYLRDIYPRNFLSPVHLSRMIEGVQLRDWIARDRRRGTLVPITENMTEWSVESNEIREIQEHLTRAEIIFDWKKWSNS